jgi:hypothetical protein
LTNFSHADARLRRAAQEQIDERMAENLRGDLDPLANSLTSLFTGH